MKAAFLTDIRRVEIGTKKAPQITQPDDVLVKVQSVGICGSDIHYYKSAGIGNQKVQFPFTIGHEGGGTVVEVGKEVDDLNPGDTIAIEPSVSCMVCDQCLRGRYHTCRNNKFLGCPGQLEGCLQEYIVMPRRNCVVLPASLGIEEGAISEPLAIGVYALKRADLKPFSRIGITGYGPIGMCVHMAARSQGQEDVFVTDLLEYRLELAEQMDAEGVALGEFNEAAKDLDVVFECCGEQEAVNKALDTLTPGGKLVIIGIPESDALTFDVHQFRRKEIDVINIRRQVGCVEEALEILASGKVDYSGFVTHRMELDQANEAFDMVTHYKDKVMKAMITL